MNSLYFLNGCSSASDPQFPYLYNMYRSITKNICNSRKKINQDTYANKITKYKNNEVSLKTVTFNIVNMPVVFSLSRSEAKNNNF